MAPGEQTTPAQLEPLSPEVKAIARAVTGWWQHGRSTSGTGEALSAHAASQWMQLIAVLYAA